MKLLLVEDDKKIATVVKRGLEAEGYTVEVAFDGADGLWLATEGSYDLIVLDIMLPHRNGFEICADLRAAGNWTPILMLTAKDGDLDEAEALDAGADDYLTKPFSFPVLVARVRSVLRRGAGRGAPVPVERRRPADRPGRRDERGGPTTRSRSRPASSTCSSSSSAASARSCPNERSSTASGSTTSRATRTSSRSTSAGSGPRSTSRSVGTPSRPCAVPGTGSSRTSVERDAAHDPFPDHRPRHDAVGGAADRRRRC